MRCAALGAAATYNVWRDPADPPITPDDLLPQKRPSEEEIERQAISFFENLGNQSAKEQAILKKH
jgi:hypothetical protein